MKKLLCLFATTFMLSDASIAQLYPTTRHNDKQGYSWTEVKGDPTHTRVYRLRNGLTVYLSRNTSQPRIQTYIPVRAGSNNDPADNTGLAHYLEHMLFKGTSKLGSLNWSKEKPELQKISDLYEQLKKTTEEVKREHIYRQIDSISQIAASYVAPNEYDRLLSELGAKGTNAHTWVEETVYQNDIPSTELERWLQIESERFGELVLRLFHTEIEAVYEEYNMNQDKVFRRIFETLNKHLFPTHPLGQQTTIGTSQHLKNPSLEAIHRYFDRYYTPSNYALVLVGDLDYDKTIRLVDQYFGKLPSHPIQVDNFAPEKPLKGIQSFDIYSKDPEQVFVGYRRSGGVGSEDEVYTTLINLLLSNGQAGLIDLNLLQAQTVLDAGAYSLIHKDYSVHYLYAMPQEGQSLEEAKALLLEQVERIKRGDFPEWLLSAVINDLELQETKGYISNEEVGSLLYKIFIYGQELSTRLSLIERMRSIKKQDLVEYARKHYADNYVAVFKRQGENASLIRVQNPGITPLKLDRSAVSAFGKYIQSQTPPSLSPEWVDYDKVIKRTSLTGRDVEYIINKDNDLFELTFILDYARKDDKYLMTALDYLDYLGTDKLTAEEVKQEFYKLGVSYQTNVGLERSTLKLSGLGRNMSEGIRLLSSFLLNLKPDEEALNQLRLSIYQDRHNAKKRKEDIFRELRSYATYGERTPTRSKPSRSELEALSASELTEKLRSLLSLDYRLFYYGKDVDGLGKTLEQVLPRPTKQAPKGGEFLQQATGKYVYYVDYDMVQTQLMMLRRVAPFDARELALQRLLNAYFGGGMSSIVFQEIREAKSLAYSAYAIYGGALKREDYNTMEAFVATQTNKLPEALSALKSLMTQMPESEESFEIARQSVLKEIEAERITRQDIFLRYERLRRLGVMSDPREAIYKELKTLTLADLKSFFERVVKGDEYTYILIGRKADLPLEEMARYGEVRELSVDELFGNQE